MTAVYDKLGLNFIYPENWKLFDDTEGDPHVVSLEAPDGSSTWAVHVYPEPVDGDEVLKEAIATLGETYQDLEISPEAAEVDQYSARGVEALFYCLDFLIRARLMWWEINQHRMLIWTQAEDRDFDKQELVFRAITTGLLRSLESSNP